jgi:serine phosphatase RsbU (regulator of sigma subunit)
MSCRINYSNSIMLIRRGATGFILIFNILFLTSENLLSQRSSSPDDLIRIDSINSLSSGFILKNNQKVFEYAQIALAESKELNYLKGQADAYYNIGDYYYYLFQKDSALHYFRLAFYTSDLVDYQLRSALSNYSMAHIYYEIDKYDDALYFAQRAVATLEGLNDSTRLASVLNLICEVYNFKGENEKAIDYCIKCIELYDQLENPIGKAKALNVIGIIYIQFKIFDKAEKHLREALNIAVENQNMEQQSVSYNSLAELYYAKNDFQNALTNFQFAYNIDISEADTFGLAYSTHSIGKTYLDLDSTDYALDFLQQSLFFSDIRQDNDLIANNYALLGKAFHRNGQNLKALDYLNKSLALAEEINAYPILHIVYKICAEVHEKSGHPANALKFYKLYMEYDDKIKMEDNARSIAEVDAIYDLAHKEKQIEFLTKENEIQILQARERDLINKGLLASIFFTLVVAGVLFNRNKIKNRSNIILKHQKEAIKKQKGEIELQRDDIQQKSLALTEFNKQITDSIEYARRIQLSLFPSRNELKLIFPESFVFNKPKNIISGDFYWVTTLEDKIFLAVVDCTGHGVPGAFMTILASSLLNQIIVENRIVCPAMTLSLLDIKVKQNLHLNDFSPLIANGMDMGLCVIDKNDRTVDFAGAKFNFYYGNGDDLCQISGNRYPIGNLLFSDKSYTSTIVTLPENTTFYLATDGFQDQFGGKNDTKFMKPNFKKLLKSMIACPIDDQYELLSDTFHSWKGHHPQTDDIVVLGVKM